jgi:hypothetical protein
VRYSEEIDENKILFEMRTSVLSLAINKVFIASKQHTNPPRLPPLLLLLEERERERRRRKSRRKKEELSQPRPQKEKFVFFLSTSSWAEPSVL